MMTTVAISRLNITILTLSLNADTTLGTYTEWSCVIDSSTKEVWK
jgi:hypothetical protein